jgi:two-component system LytT family response regulator
VSEIFLVESEGNYSRVYFQNNKPLIYCSLNSVEERLDPATFFRANRTRIFNLNYIKSMKAGLGSTMNVMLQNDLAISISRRDVQKLKSLLSL